MEAPKTPKTNAKPAAKEGPKNAVLPTYNRNADTTLESIELLEKFINSSSATLFDDTGFKNLFIGIGEFIVVDGVKLRKLTWTLAKKAGWDAATTFKVLIVLGRAILTFGPKKMMTRIPSSLREDVAKWVSVLQIMQSSQDKQVLTLSRFQIAFPDVCYIVLGQMLKHDETNVMNSTLYKTAEAAGLYFQFAFSSAPSLWSKADKESQSSAFINFQVAWGKVVGAFGKDKDGKDKKFKDEADWTVNVRKYAVLAIGSQVMPSENTRTQFTAKWYVANKFEITNADDGAWEFSGLSAESSKEEES